MKALGARSQNEVVQLGILDILPVSRHRRHNTTEESCLDLRWSPKTPEPNEAQDAYQQVIAHSSPPRE